MSCSDTKIFHSCDGLLIHWWIYGTCWWEYFNKPTSCWLSKQTNNSFDSFLWSCNEIKRCGSVGFRRSRTCFWILAWVFCLSVCGVFLSRSHWTSAIYCFFHLICNLETQLSLYSTIFVPLSDGFNSYYCMGFLSDSWWGNLGIGHVFLVGVQCFLLSLVVWRFWVTLAG